MSLPDEHPAVTSFVQEETINGLTKTLAARLSHMPPIVRLRLLAFMHLVEDPAEMRALLEISPTGSMRLTLDTAVAPCPIHRH